MFEQNTIILSKIVSYCCNITREEKALDCKFNKYKKIVNVGLNELVQIDKLQTV